MSSGRGSFRGGNKPIKKYLVLLCFVVYQFYQLGDLLTETLLQAVQTHRNAAQRETQERVYRQQQDTATQLWGNCSTGWCATVRPWPG